MIEDLAKPEGHIPRLLDWLGKNQHDLRSRFLKRFQDRVQEDTRRRFLEETEWELLQNRVHQATGEFDRLLRDLENARKRLRDQREKLENDEQDALREIEQELRILAGRLQGLNRTTALEILTDHGLLPNYAFPERGVRFYGAVYNRHRRSDQEYKPIEVTRPAGVALKELAPANHFYTHSRCFDVQQIAIGNPQQPIVQTWAICGACGHMRRAEELEQPEVSPACPQCGHDRDADSQLDQGQHGRFVEYSKSQALSYMEHYASLSGDRRDERNRQAYHVLRSFDLTQEAPSGAVADEGLPFGIEYRASVILREVNVGYLGDPGLVPFGVDQKAPEDGFEGNPAHLIVAPQVMPDPASGMKRYYLVLLDAVPGGTGYLKTLYQDKGQDPRQRDGEGVMQVLRLAKNALETCVCRPIKDSRAQPDTDGCYRCIRTYELVIDPNGIDDEETYLTTVRSGRPRISRRQRRAAWPVFRAFQRGVKKRKLLTFEGAVHEARLAVEQGDFTRYAHVLVDEVQDFSLEALRLIRAISPIGEGTPDPLCTVGDGHQRIYRTKIPMSRAGIDIRGRSRRLKINYRTSEQIRRFAQGMLQGIEIDDLDGGVTTTLGDHSVFTGPEPVVHSCPDQTVEAETITAWVRKLMQEHGLASHEICVTPYKKQIRNALSSADVPTYDDGTEQRSLEVRPPRHGHDGLRSVCRRGRRAARRDRASGGRRGVLPPQSRPDRLRLPGAPAGAGRQPWALGRNPFGVGRLGPHARPNDFVVL